MKNLATLIQELCPEGVKFVKLGDVMDISRGASPRPIQKYLTDDPSGVNWIKIGDVENNAKYITETKEKITAEGALKSRLLHKGDFVLSNSMSFGRPYILAIEGCIHDGWISMSNYQSVLLPDFLYHLLRSYNIQKYWKQKASSGTVSNLNADIVRKTEIPLPPLEVQTEIVRILDKFTSLEAELETELDCRKRQYEYYRDKLLSFDNVGGQEVEWKKMSEVGTFIRGNGLQKKDFTEEGVGCIHYGQLYTHYGTSATETITYCSSELAKKLRKAAKGDIVIATTSENVEDVCKAVAWLGEEEIAVSGDAFIYKHTQNPKYMAYLFQTASFFNYKKKKATGTKVIRLTGDAMGNYLAPIPSLEEQQRIVSILDRFESLTTSLQSGLPAEIAARRQQYEHYRDKLLTFKRKGVA